MAENIGKIPANGDVRLAGRRFYHPELDVMRFLAFYFVFAPHSIPLEGALRNRGIPGIVAEAIAAFSSAGRFGVDFFFVLRSYLIAELLLRERARFGDVDVRSF
jgi:peptidoglycan/LPS O-acetylase OafA/YrhL